MQDAKKSYISFKTQSQINLFKRTRIIDNVRHAQNNANYSKNYSLCTYETGNEIFFRILRYFVV